MSTLDRHGNAYKFIFYLYGATIMKTRFCQALANLVAKVEDD
jgi:hypothetical protein